MFQSDLELYSAGVDVPIQPVGVVSCILFLFPGYGLLGLCLSIFFCYIVETHSSECCSFEQKFGDQKDGITGTKYGPYLSERRPITKFQALGPVEHAKTEASSLWAGIKVLLATTQFWPCGFSVGRQRTPIMSVWASSPTHMLDGHEVSCLINPHFF